MAIIRELFAKLGFKVDNSGLKKFNSGLQTTRKSLSGLKTAAVGAAAAIAGVITGATSKKLFDANAQYQKLMARLKTLEGGTDKAKAKFDELQRIATTTPFQLTDLVDMYARLKAAGFDASEANIRALGDLASSSGKSLNDIVETLLSANRGLGSMVDNFNGLSASAKGGNLELKNASTGLKKMVKAGDTKGILEFFVLAGKAPGVAGSMANQMQTLGGKLSNLQDNMFKLMVSIGKAGFTEAMTELMTALVEGIEGGESAAPIIGKILGQIIRGFTQFVKFIQRNKKLVLIVIGAIVLAIASVMAPILTIGLALALVLDDLFSFFRGGPSLIGKFIKKFKNAPGPVGDLVRWFLRMVDAGRLLASTIVKVFREVEAKVAPEMEALRDTLVDVWDDIKDAVGEALTELFGEDATLGDTLVKGILFMKDVLVAVLPAMAVLFKLFLSNVVGGIRIMWIVFKAVVGFMFRAWVAGMKIMNIIFTIFSSAFTRILAAMSNLFASRVSAMMAVFRLLGRVINVVLAGIRTASSSAWTMFSNAAATAIGAIITKVQNLITLIQAAVSAIGGLAAGGGVDALVQGAKSAIAGLTGTPATAPAGGLASAAQTAGGAGPGNTSVQQNVSGASVNVTVNSTNASANEIGNAVGSGVDTGTKSAMSNARRDLEGGLG